MPCLQIREPKRSWEGIYELDFALDLVTYLRPEISRPLDSLVLYDFALEAELGSSKGQFSFQTYSHPACVMEASIYVS